MAFDDKNLIDRNLDDMLSRAYAAHSSDQFVLEAVDRFREIHSPKEPPHPKRDEDNFKQISARIPLGVLGSADRIASTLAVSRNEVIISALQYYTSAVSERVRQYANDVSRTVEGSHLLDIVDGQLDFFEGDE